MGSLMGDPHGDNIGAVTMFPWWIVVVFLIFIVAGLFLIL